MTDEKTRENRLRRLAYRMGYQIMKGRRRWLGAGTSGFMIVDDEGRVITGDEAEAFSLSLDDVDAWLEDRLAERAKPRAKPKRKTKK